MVTDRRAIRLEFPRHAGGIRIFRADHPGKTIRWRREWRVIRFQARQPVAIAALRPSRDSNSFHREKPAKAILRILRVAPSMRQHSNPRRRRLIDFGIVPGARFLDFVAVLRIKPPSRGHMARGQRSRPGAERKACRASSQKVARLFGPDDAETIRRISRKFVFPCLRLRSFEPFRGSKGSAPAAQQERQDHGSLRACISCSSGRFRPAGGSVDRAIQRRHRSARRQDREDRILGRQIRRLSDQEEPQSAFHPAEHRRAGRRPDRGRASGRHQRRRAALLDRPRRRTRGWSVGHAAQTRRRRSR